MGDVVVVVVIFCVNSLVVCRVGVSVVLPEWFPEADVERSDTSGKSPPNTDTEVTSSTINRVVTKRNIFLKLLKMRMSISVGTVCFVRRHAPEFSFQLSALPFCTLIYWLLIYLLLGLTDPLTPNIYWRRKQQRRRPPTLWRCYSNLTLDSYWSLLSAVHSEIINPEIPVHPYGPPTCSIPSGTMRKKTISNREYRCITSQVSFFFFKFEK